MIEGLENLISNECSTGYKGLLMNKLVKIWSGESYYIEDVGMKASVDLQHKKMHLPLNKEDWQTLRALGQHESAHILFTNIGNYIKQTKGLCKKYDKDKVWRVVNAFEDRRVEYLFSKIYAGAETEFRDKNTESLKELLGKIYTLKPIDRIIVQICAYMINGIRPEDKELQVLAEEAKEEIESKWVQQSVVNVSGKVLDYLDKYLAKREKEREDTKAKERIRTSGEKDDKYSDGISEEEDKSEDKGELDEPIKDEPFDIDKFLDEDGETEESKEDIEKTKDDGKSEKGESDHKDIDLSETPKEPGKDSDEDYDNEEDLKTEEDIIGKKEKIEESRFKSKTKNKKDIKKVIEKRKSVVIDSDDVEKKDPFKKFSKESYIPVRKLITEEELEKNFTELHKQYYEVIKNKNIGLVRRLQMNLMEIKNAVEIQESKGGLININRSINMVAQSGRPEFSRAVENTNRNVSLTFLLDQSGSMAGSKIREAKEALIILSEVLNGLHGFEFALFGFSSKDNSSYGKDFHTMKTFHYKGFSTKKTDLIASAHTYGGNRDGYHIRVVRDYIQRHASVNAAKFLVVLSDGIPQDDNTEYVGQIALNDTMKAVQKVEGQFPVIGVLFGNPRPEQQHLYKNRVHCASGRLSEGLEELVLNVQQQIMRG